MIDKAQAADPPLLFNDPDPKKDLAPRWDADLHDAGDKLWKKILYREQPRAVCKGRQQPLSRLIEERTGHADLHQTWLDRLGNLYDGYDSVHLGGHPDYDHALQQLRRRVKPLQGPRTCIR